MKGIGTIRIVSPTKTAGAQAAAAPLFPVQATLPNAFMHGGKKGHLQLDFITDANGEVSKPKMSLAGAPAHADPGLCDPICVTYGNPKKTRCFYPGGCGPNPHPLPTLDQPMAVEFGSKAAGKNAREMDIKLYRHGDKTAAARSNGVLKFSKTGGKQAKKATPAKPSSKSAKASAKAVGTK